MVTSNATLRLLLDCAFRSGSHNVRRHLSSDSWNREPAKIDPCVGRESTDGSCSEIQRGGKVTPGTPEIADMV